MKKKIEKLTAQQERDLVAFRERMWRQGVSCAPMDRATAERAITDAYAEIGKSPPRFFWMPSPMSASLALYVLRQFSDDATRPAAGLGAGLWDGLWAGLGDGLRAGLGDGLRAGLGDGLMDGLMAGLRAGLGDGLMAGLGDGLMDGLMAGLRDGLMAGLMAGLRDGLGDGLGAGLGDGLWAGLRAGLGDGLMAGLRAGLRAGLWAGLGAGLGDGLGAGLRDGLWAGLGDGLGAGLGDGLRAGLGDGLMAGLRDGLGAGLTVADSQTYWWGQMDTFWLAFYRFGTDLGVAQKAELIKRLDIMENIASSVGFWYPRDGVCIVSDRFAGVHWDESRNRVGMPFRLHCEDGPAVSFRDGWGLYYWHGYRIPPQSEWIIADKARITPDLIDAEANAELRRVMLEIYGFERYVEQRGAKVISADTSHGRPRRLLEAKVGGENIRILDVVNGSLEPDGSRRRFHLGAMTGAKTPHEAVAMSYGRAPKSYGEACRS